MRLRSPFWSALLMLAMLILPAARSVAVAAQATEGAYTSPTYGYSVSWDDTWSVQGETSESGVDTLSLTNGASNLTLVAFAADIDAAACLQQDIQTLSANPSYQNVRPAQAADGGNLAGAVGDVRWAVLWFTFVAEDGSSSEITAYVECRPIEAGASLLLARNFALFDDYNAQIELVLRVLETIQTGTAAAEPFDYVSPTYGYGLRWDESVWTKTDESSDGTTDVLSLETANSAFSIVGTVSGDTARACIDGQIASFEPNGFTDVQPAQDTDGNPLAGEGPGMAWAVVWMTRDNGDGTTTDYTSYLECREVDPGRAIVQFVQFVPFDAYNDEIAARVTLLESFTLEASAASPTPATEHYTSPTYGYRLSWDAPWTANNENSTDGTDSLTLVGENGVVQLLGFKMDGTPSDCIDAQLALYQSGDGYADGAIVVANGEEVRQDGADSASAVMTYTYTGGSEPARFTAYVECRQLGSGEMLIITGIAVEEQAAEHIAAVTALLEGLELS